MTVLFEKVYKQEIMLLLDGMVVHFHKGFFAHFPTAFTGNLIELFLALAREDDQTRGIVADAL